MRVTAYARVVILNQSVQNNCFDIQQTVFYGGKRYFSFSEKIGENSTNSESTSKYMLT